METVREKYPTPTQPEPKSAGNVPFNVIVSNTNNYRGKKSYQFRLVNTKPASGNELLRKTGKHFTFKQVMRTCDLILSFTGSVNLNFQIKSDKSISYRMPTKFVSNV